MVLHGTRSGFAGRGEAPPGGLFDLLHLGAAVGPGAANRRCDVAKLGVLLAATGHLDPAMAAKETHGPDLDAALRAFQRRNGLAPDFGALRRWAGAASLGGDLGDLPRFVAAAWGIGPKGRMEVAERIGPIADKNPEQASRPRRRGATARLPRRRAGAVRRRETGVVTGRGKVPIRFKGRRAPAGGPRRGGRAPATR